jgi:hypothetical protein
MMRLQNEDLFAFVSLFSFRLGSQIIRTVPASGVEVKKYITNKINEEVKSC